jgi:hypothetical protein
VGEYKYIVPWSSKYLLIRQITTLRFVVFC